MSTEVNIDGMIISESEELEFNIDGLIFQETTAGAPPAPSADNSIFAGMNF